jgi:hypothetical protein
LIITSEGTPPYEITKLYWNDGIEIPLPPLPCDRDDSAPRDPSTLPVVLPPYGAKWDVKPVATYKNDAEFKKIQTLLTKDGAKAVGLLKINGLVRARAYKDTTREITFNADFRNGDTKKDITIVMYRT